MAKIFTLGEDRYEVLDRPAKNALIMRDLCLNIWSIAVLKDGPLQTVCVQLAIWTDIRHDEPLGKELCTKIPDIYGTKILLAVYRVPPTGGRGWLKF